MYRFSPAKWDYVASHIDEAIYADVPTVIGYKTQYGEQAVAEWMYAQVLAIYAESPNRDTAMENSIRSFAKGFISYVGGYRLTELMIFFHGYKEGRFGTSMSTFDARQIGIAFRTNFDRYIKDQRRQYNVRKAQAEYVNNRFTAPEGYTPLSLYKTLKGLAEQGDEQARAILSNPAATTEEIAEYIKTKNL